MYSFSKHILNESVTILYYDRLTCQCVFVVFNSKNVSIFVSYNIIPNTFNLNFEEKQPIRFR